MQQNLCKKCKQKELCKKMCKNTKNGVKNEEINV